MKKIVTLGLISIVTASLLSSCSGSGSSGGNISDTNTTQEGYRYTFKSMSIVDQVEELMGGIIGIVDEVGNGKIGDPLGESLDKADTTLVESQFSWNSTMDFYNNLISVQNVWNGGLADIVARSYPSEAQEITLLVQESLALIADISDYDGDGVLTTADLMANDGEVAFRQQILNTTGRAKIELAQDKLSQLLNALESIKPQLAPTSEDITLASAVVDSVIVTGYEELLSQSNNLVTILGELKNNPTVENLQNARAAWRETRAPWEAGEGHIFGPVDTLGIDPKVDSWPVEISSLDGALGGYDSSLSSIDGFPVTMKGFHAMEYLLFGGGTTLEDESTTLARLLTPVGDEDSSEDKIRLTYLEALGISFQKDIAKLVKAW